MLVIDGRVLTGILAMSERASIVVAEMAHIEQSARVPPGLDSQAVRPSTIRSVSASDTLSRIIAVTAGVST